jgi:hypothetical protein
VANSRFTVSLGSVSSNTSGQLRHLTEDLFEDAVEQDKNESEDHASNDTNEVDLLYFARVSNHYLRLVKNHSSRNSVSRHDMQFPIIIDSGANFHMFKDKEFFSSIIPATGKVILGDGVTSLPIEGVGTVLCNIDSHTFQIDNVHYVPALSESIYSLFLHIQNPNHGIQSSFDKGLFLRFPAFQTKAIIGRMIYTWMPFL